MGAPPYVPGQFSQAAQPQAATQPQLPDNDQIEQLKQSLAQQAQPKPSDSSGGPITRLLKNFIGGMGQSMMHEAGLPTEYERQQRATSNYIQLTNAQVLQQMHGSDIAYRQAMIQAMQPGMQVLTPQDAAAFGHPELAGRTWKDAFGYLGKIVPAQIQAGPLVNTTPEMRGMGLPEQVPIKQAGAAQGIISKQEQMMDVTPEMRQMFHLPESAQKISGTSLMLGMRAMISKTTTTQDWKVLEDGSVVPFPKTTVTQPTLDMPSASVGGGGSGIRVNNGVATLNGKPVIGKGGISGTTKTMAETAPKVEELAERMLSHIDTLDRSGDLGPGMSRWNEFWSGKVGTDNPEFRRMMTDSSLLSTLLMRMHTGARGAVQMMQHFDNILGSGHQSAANMRAAIDEILQYARDVKGSSPLPTGFGRFNQSAPTGGDPFAQFGGRKR